MEALDILQPPISTNNHGFTLHLFPSSQTIMGLLYIGSLHHRTDLIGSKRFGGVWSERGNTLNFEYASH